MEFVPVQDAGNVADRITKLGAVAAPYQIGKYEVTVAQWCGFLNAVASKADPHGLYNPNMTSDPKIACIQYGSTNGVKIYSPLPNADQLPITYVSYNNALRFCNWYQNGMPTSLQGDDAVVASTENGAYHFTQLENGMEKAVLSKHHAICTLATEDQWMKAAYYAGSGTNSGYWLYPTKHNNAPNIGSVNVANEANWDTTSYAHYWSGLEDPKSLVLTPVNYYFQTMGAYGSCDMGGNVNEWIMRSNEEDPSSPFPVTRGGSWASTYFAPNHWALSANELMRTAPAQTYDEDSSALAVGNNMIGFRLVCSMVPPTAEEMAAAMDSLKNGSASPANDMRVLQLQGVSQGESWATFLGNGVEDALIAAAVTALSVGVVYCLPFWILDGLIGASDGCLLALAERLGINEGALGMRAGFAYMRAQLGDFWNWVLRPVRSAATSASDYFRGGGPMTRGWRRFWRFVG